MSQVRLTGSGGGNTILNGNDTIAADQTFEFPNAGGTLLTGSQTETGSGGSSGNAKVVGYQQGVWVPRANEGTNSSASNTWSRIGNRVTVTAQIAAFTTLAARSILIYDLPYEVSVASLGSAMTNTFNNGATATYADPAGNNEANLRFFASATANTQAWRELQYGDRRNDANSSIWFSVDYLTDDTTWTPTGNNATVS